MAGISTTFRIRWFRENTTGVVEDLGLGDPIVQQGKDWTSRYHNKCSGKYWCQVINTTADPDQPLMRSNVFTLLAPGNYSGSKCMGVQEIINRTCANLPPQPKSIVTTVHLQIVSGYVLQCTHT